MSSEEEHPLLDVADGQARAGGWIRGALQRVTTEAVARVLSYLVPALSLLTCSLAVYLLTAKDAWSVCSLSSAGSVAATTFGTLVPFAVSLVYVFIWFMHLEPAAPWGALVMLDVSCSIALLCWFSVCGCGAAVTPALTGCSLLLGVMCLLWICYRLEVLGYVRSLMVRVFAADGHL